MRYLILLFLLWAVPVQAQVVTVTDDFNRADDPDLGATWDAGYTSSDACEITNNKVRLPLTSTQGICVETWNANTFTSDQTAQIVLATWQGAIEGTANIFLKVGATNPVRNWYRCAAHLNNGSMKTQIQKRVTDVTVDSTDENASGDWVATDVFKCTATGSTTVTVTVYKNGTPVLTYVDSSSPHNGDYIGFGPGSVLGSFAEIELDDFSGGDLVSAVPSTRHRVVVVQ